MTQKRTAIIRKILKRIRPHAGLVILSFACALFSVIGSLYIPILVGRAIDAIVGPGAVAWDLIGVLLVKIAIIAVITAVLMWVMALCNNRVTFLVVRGIRNDAIEKIQTLPLSWLDTQSYGSVVSRVIADTDQFADGLLLGFTQLFSGVVAIITTLIFMLRLQPLVALVVVCLTPVSLFAARFIASRTYRLFQEQSDIRAQQTALIGEMITNQKIVTAFGRADHVQQAFDDVNERLAKTGQRAVFFSSLTNPVTRFVNALVYMAVALCGALMVIGGSMTVGTLAAFLSYATQYTRPFNEISGVITEMQNAFACAGRMFEFLEEESECADAPGAAVLTQPQGRVAAKDVAFSYDKSRPLIREMAFDVKPGQKVAVVGPTGCGKTTLINLLMRFYELDEGTITIDGTDIRALTRESLRSGFGMVLQDTWLFSGTVRENIAMGRPDADIDEIIQAAKAAHADTFIRQLPDGYETVISDEGMSLSAGQKQLLCIARVMLAKPSMLILDEATSSIDTRTERLVQDAFLRLMEGRTSFIVAHRLSTIRDADLILVMKDGLIIERGTHESLLAKDGFYAQLAKPSLL